MAAGSVTPRAPGSITVLGCIGPGGPSDGRGDSGGPGCGHVVQWTGRDEAGRMVGSGIYYVRVEGDGIRETRMVVKIE